MENSNGALAADPAAAEVGASSSIQLAKEQAGSFADVHDDVDAAGHFENQLPAGAAVVGSCQLSLNDAVMEIAGSPVSPGKKLDLNVGSLPKVILLEGCFQFVQTRVPLISFASMSSRAQGAGLNQEPLWAYPSRSSSELGSDLEKLNGGIQIPVVSYAKAILDGQGSEWLFE